MKTPPFTPSELPETPWEKIEPYYLALLDFTLTAESAPEWLAGWSRLREMVDEANSRLSLANNRNTADQAAESRYHTFLSGLYTKLQAADQKLKEKLIASGIEPSGFAIPLRNMRSEAALFRQENLPLQAEEHKLSMIYNKIIGAQTVEWDGEQVTPQQLKGRLENASREERERAWRLVADRQLADRQGINENWQKLMGVRKQIAANANFSDYRAFRWQQFLRFDYTPENCMQFHAAIEAVAVPAATRVYQRHCQRLGVETVRPWDLSEDLYPLRNPPLRAAAKVDEMPPIASRIFHKVDPRLGDYFDTMRAEDLLDLENRPNKAPGAFCTSFATLKRPFVFANAVGLSPDARTLLHECGHAFHVFERTNLPYHQQHRVTMEFSEVASMSMEFLAIPYLNKKEGGFYDDEGARRAVVEQMERALLFWPYMAVVDAFQHWVYTNHAQATDPAACDAKWAELWRRFIPGVDFSGLEDALDTGWHRKQHIHRVPFYYVEYGLAQLGAVQVYANALRDQSAAVAAYLHALSQGGTVGIPQLFEAANVHFAFDKKTLGQAVELLESNIEELDS